MSSAYACVRQARVTATLTAKRPLGARKFMSSGYACVMQALVTGPPDSLHIPGAKKKKPDLPLYDWRINLTK